VRALASLLHPAERPVLTVQEVFVLAAAVPPRFRVLVLLATFGSMRWGELAAVRRHSVDLEARRVRIEASVAEMKTGNSSPVGPRRMRESVRSPCPR
jgi:hypothetical protein